MLVLIESSMNAETECFLSAVHSDGQCVVRSERAIADKVAEVASENVYYYVCSQAPVNTDEKVGTSHLRGGAGLVMLRLSCTTAQRPIGAVDEAG